ncbi:MAG: hypothetical protein C0476_00735 [Sphingomonas sp.]|nr:hypothetical protein [Sphingomonas sp.]
MASDAHPTINDFLSRLYTIRDDLAVRASKKAKAIAAQNSARGLLRSGATLKALAEVIENEFEAGLADVLASLRYMKSVPGLDYQACREQAFLRARDLVPVLRGACELDKFIEMVGSGKAGEVINNRVEALFPKIEYRFRQFDVGLDGLSATETSVPSPVASTVAPDRKPRGERRFQVALSFAGEQREYVREVAKFLSAKHIAVFYDEFETNTLWGKDGAEHFHHVYSQDTQYVVMFISEEYVAKAWTRHERRAAISRQMKDAGEYILPVRFDNSDVPGLSDALQYLHADSYTPAALASEIAKKVGIRPTSGKASDTPAPASGAMSGEVTFDYGAFNGRYVIGTGAMEFETRWSKASDTSIYLVNDPPSIHGIALARGAAGFEQITDASAFDFTSRVRTVRIGEIAILCNVNGFYAGVQVLEIQDDSRGASSDALTIRYVILPGGQKDFTTQVIDASLD